jgi:hypothetical protein
MTGFPEKFSPILLLEEFFVWKNCCPVALVFEENSMTLFRELIAVS